MIDEASMNQSSNDDMHHTSTDKNSNKQTTNGNSIEGAYKHREVLVVIETMCSIVGDSLRPSIIHETDVDELCGVVGMFALILPGSSRSMAKKMMSILTSAILCFFLFLFIYSSLSISISLLLPSLCSLYIIVINCSTTSAILAEDVRSHMKNAALPRSLLKELLKGLSRTVNDAKERLSYVR